MTLRNQIVEPAIREARQALIERLQALGHLQGQPRPSPEVLPQPLAHDELRQLLPRLDPPLSSQILEGRR